MSVRDISSEHGRLVIEVNGEYRVCAEVDPRGMRVHVAMARTPKVGDHAAMHLAAVFGARGALLERVPIIDGVMLVVRAEDWRDGLLECATRRFCAGDPEALTVAGARDAVLQRLADAGGEREWEEAAPETLEAVAFPLGYRARDASIDLIAAGEVEAVRRRGLPPRLRLTDRGRVRLSRAATVAQA